MKERQPINSLRWVPVEKVQANDYNPNQVAERELYLLYNSIKEDGWTQPIVTVYDKEKDIYIVVDGFHRCLIPRLYNDIYRRDEGKVPIVIVDKPMSDRMTSTIRHNRARGKHTIAGMSNLIFKLAEQGISDEEICNRLGMEPDEFVRLKYLTGFDKYFGNIEYNRAWKTQRQIELEKISSTFK